MPLTLTRIAEPEIAPIDVLDLPVVPSRQVVPARARRVDVDIVDEWGMQSFPASDPPANW